MKTKRPIKCKLCEGRAASMDDLRGHWATEHPEQFAPIQRALDQEEEEIEAQLEQIKRENWR